MEASRFKRSSQREKEVAILSGCSTGGLASILHCDNFKALVPMVAKVKCFADAWYFINAKDISGAPHIEDFYYDVVKTHSEPTRQ
ncbi:pectin acetylesterase 8-like [Olea europaea subsp. europaea]|uniref:Pectin acetylesterase n=1 Tax=Olea europaea subsp. europaea TaxID=158383 RepID=A0A8S0VBZ1_OLEEU|nr:pectin acetylesterase 8-like [Olea europaea subsp. europaea]